MRYPNTYFCRKCETPPVIDGKLDDHCWDEAPWTEDFVDIEGDDKEKPRFRTRAKMLWDEDYLYIAAELEEPHVNGFLTEKNSIIFHDNDFEVFIDPDGDNHNYYEFEMNALNTIWELTLPRPYRAGGDAVLGTNLDGLKSAVHIEGTLNDPSDTDKYWSLEIAFPWAGLAKFAGKMDCPPGIGDKWRMNFSRVEWMYDIIDGSYQKIPKETSPEDNWVWSPQGVVNMHIPWHWGVVQFCEEISESSGKDPLIETELKLMYIYELQHQRLDDGLELLTELADEDVPFEQGDLEICTDSDGNWYAEMSCEDLNGNTVRCRVDHLQHFTHSGT
jgi:hypothetical protein